MSHVLTCRGALAALGAFALPSAIVVRGALAQAGVRFRDIRVDVSPLRASAGDPTAAWVQEALPGQLAQALGPYMSPGERNGATLVARIKESFSGRAAAEPGRSAPSQDTIEGDIVIRDREAESRPRRPCGRLRFIIQAQSTSR